MSIVSCSHCGKIHHKKPRDVTLSKSGKLFCSNRCHRLYVVAQREHKCPVCGKDIPGPNRLGKKTCNRSCANKLRTGIKYFEGQPNSTYATVTKLRAALVSVRGPRCERCPYNRNPRILIVHHVIERAKGGTNDLDNLELLCPNCHAEHHYGSDPAG